MMITLFQIMAKSHTNCNRISNCCFILINMSYINSEKSQEIVEVKSILKHCFSTVPSQHIRLVLWWDDDPLSSSVFLLEILVRCYY